MAQREVDRLVNRIRLQRRRVSRAWSHWPALRGMQESIDRHPLGWLVGGTLVGFVTLPLLVPVLLAAPRRLARLWMRGAIQGGVVHLAQGALVDLWHSHPHDAAAASGPDEVWTSRPGPIEEPPLQASGGPVRPMSPS